MATCTMCMFGISTRKMWECARCHENNCPHLWKCGACGLSRYESSAIRKQAALDKEAKKGKPKPPS